MNNDGDHPHPTAYALKKNLIFSKTVSERELQSKISLFLADLTEELKHGGYMLIGHIKGLIDADDHGHLMFSMTSFKENARFKGNLLGKITKAVLTVNVIMYGIEQKIIGTMLHNVFNQHFNNGGKNHAP